MIHHLKPGQTVTVKVYAHTRYSLNSFAVKSGEHYRCYCQPAQRWKDWFIWSGPDGYFNPLAWLFGTRVKGSKCFCLCGVFDRDDGTAFRIGTERRIEVENGASLCFFANDSRFAYRNNSGSVRVEVTRLL